MDVLIVDDEDLALELLENMLAALPGVNVVAKARNGREAIEATLVHNPDLIFLDIQMPGMGGFDVIKALQADVMPMVVFCTAYQEYALDAFDLHAVDYVLKPIDEDRLLRSVQRAQARLDAAAPEGENKTTLIGAIDKIARKAAKSSPLVEEPAEKEGRKLAIKDSYKVTLVEQSDIEWIDAAGDYMCVHERGNTHITRCTLTEMLDKLNAERFKRIHRSTLVNLDAIEQVVPHTKGEYFVVLRCGERLKVSRNFKTPIKEFLERQ